LAEVKPSLWIDHPSPNAIQTMNHISENSCTAILFYWKKLNPYNSTSPDKLKLKGLIFDLDSTLIQAHIDFVDMKIHMINLLEVHGHPDGTLSPTDMTTVQIIEKAKREWNKQDKSKEECAMLVEQIEHIMNQGELNAITNLTEIEGASQAIKSLKDKSLKLAILTRSHHAYAVQALKKLGIYNDFDTILGRHETPEPKPYKGAIDHTIKLMNLSIENVAMIGDHQIDRDSAINSGCLFIGVNTGRRGLRSWRDEQPPEHFLHSVAELPEYLASKGFI
jgi:phosphoglycolate phosphatase-like HAD superfamily hydrolase